MPKEQITHLVVEGDVQINSVSYEGQGGAGAPPPAWQPPVGQFPPLPQPSRVWTSSLQ